MDAGQIRSEVPSGNQSMFALQCFAGKIAVEAPVERGGPGRRSVLRNSTIYPDLISSPLVVDLPDGLARTLIDQCALYHYGERTYLMRQGGQSPGIYLVAEGSVEVSYSDASGNVSILHTAGRGEVVGEVESIAEKPCAASCVAMPGSRALFLPKRALVPYLREPAFVRNVVAILHRRLARNTRVKSMDDYGTVDVRLRAYLWEMSASQRTVTVSQQYLSVVVGCSRETINRKLRRLSDEGVLALARTRVTILDRARLRQ